MCHRLEMTEQCPLLKQNPGHDAVIARVMARTFRDGRKRMRINADLSPPPHDSVNARHRTVQMTARIVETAADPAGDGVQVDMLDPPAARWALKPRPRLLVPHHQNAVPVDQNIWCLSGELAPPVVAPLKPRDCPFDEHADAVEFERIQADPGLDQTVGWEACVVLIVE
jgi:hypothetical protein